MQVRACLEAISISGYFLSVYKLQVTVLTLEPIDFVNMIFEDYVKTGFSSFFEIQQHISMNICGMRYCIFVAFNSMADQRMAA